MTENEALNTLHILLAHEKAIDAGEIISPNNLHSQEKEALQFILEEIQQYRAIGTVEEIQSMKERLLLARDMCKDYYAIGTVDDFKALKEKSVAKKPNKSGVTDSNGVFHAINGINGVPYDLCPNCEINLCTDGMFGGNRDGMKYCKNCGQKLDWSE